LTENMRADRGRPSAASWKVVSCYEAGPFGFWLHRRLLELGATNYVIRPRHWDDQHKGVKTDRTDARPHEKKENTDHRVLEAG